MTAALRLVDVRAFFAWSVKVGAAEHLRASLRSARLTVVLLAVVTTLLVGARIGEWLHAWGLV